MEYYAWLDRGTCRAVAEPVRMLQRIPDVELEGVLLYQNAHGAGAVIDDR